MATPDTDTRSDDSEVVDLGPLDGTDLRVWHLPDNDPKLRELQSADDATSVACDFAERAFNDWTLILRTKRDFFRDIYEDGRWETVFEFADRSRRYSQLIKRIWYVMARLRGHDSAPKPPSSTEVNAWFHHFDGARQLRERDVPEHLIPDNRSVSAALAAATQQLSDPKQRMDAQVAILQRFDAEDQRNQSSGCSGLTLTAKTVTQLAGDLGFRKVRIAQSSDPRAFADLDAETWARLVQLIQQLSQLRHSQRDTDKVLPRALALFRKVERLIAAPERFVVAELDDTDCFVSWAVENFRTTKTPGATGVKHAKKFDGYLRRDGGSGDILSRLSIDRCKLKDNTFVPEPDGLVHPPGANGMVWMAMGDEPTKVGQVFARIAMASDAREKTALLSECVSALGARCVAVPLSTWQYWDRNGGCPVGTYIDEVLEPTEAFIAGDDDDGSDD